MVAHGDEQIEKQFATAFHFHLHGPAPLESLATSDDQGQVMSAEPRVRVRRVVVRIPGRPKDHVGLDPRLEALLAEGEPLQLVQAVLLRGTVYDGISKESVADARVEHDGFTGPATTSGILVLGALEVPRVPTFALQQTRIVVTLVQVLEDAGQCLGFSLGKRKISQTDVHSRIEKSGVCVYVYALVKQAQLFRTLIQHLLLESSAEKGRERKDVLVRGEKPLVRAHDHRHNRTGQGAVK